MYFLLAIIRRGFALLIDRQRKQAEENEPSVLLGFKEGG